MVGLTCNIGIGKYEFTSVNSVVISSSWKNLTDTCEISLPRNLKIDQQDLRSLFKAGDAVSVKLGYDEDNQEEFSGYVVRVESSTPVKVHCEDGMWPLKRTTFTKSYTNVKLATLLADMLGSTPFEALDVELGPMRISNASPAKVLEELRTKWGIYSYFQAGKLYSGLPYPLKSTIVKLDMNWNVHKDSDLRFRKADETLLKVKAISILPNNSREEVELGDDTGEARTLHFYNVPKSALTDRATKELARLKYDGFEGRVTAFGDPFIRHGYTVELKDDQLTERVGKYLVDSVRVEFGQGFKRQIEIGPKA